MIAVLIAGVAALFGAAGLVAYVAVTRRGTPVPAGDVLTVPGGTPIAGGPYELSPLQRRMATLAARFTRPGHRQRMQRRLDLAGNPRNWEPERLLAFRGFGLVGGVLLGLLVGVRHGGSLALFAPVIGGVGGFLIPGVVLHNMAEKRQIELRKGLPEALDMLTVCVEAGLGFDSALGRVARNQTGPTAEECARVLQEMQFGKSRSEALRALAERTDVSELRSFASAIVQSAELGITIGDVLREQSKQMRVQRRQRAEEKAQKLQVKLLLPLISCLLPAMFIVVLGPAVIQLTHFFKAVGK